MKICPYGSEPIHEDAQVGRLCQTPLGPLAPPIATGDSFPPAYAETSGKAIASLVCGIAGFVIPILSAIAAIVLGHLSLSEIRKSGGRLKGQSMAVAGLVLGYVGVAFLPFILIIAAIAIPNLLRSRMAANEASAVGSLRVYETALVTYNAQSPNTGFPPSTINLAPGAGDYSRANLVDSLLRSAQPSKSAYRFTFVPGRPDTEGRIMSYTITADPITAGPTGPPPFFPGQTRVPPDQPHTAR